MTIAFVPASILQGSRRFEVLEPLVERALSPDRVLLLHPPSGRWVIVRAESLAGVRMLLAACAAGQLDSADETEIWPLVTDLLKGGLIRERRTVPATPSGCGRGARRRVNLLILKMVGFCDLACRYCYDFRSETYSLRMLEETARQAIRQALGCAGPQLQILFHGGEPLLAFDTIRQLVPFAKTEAASCDRQVTFAVQTNGLHFSPEVLEFLLAEHFTIGISIDGTSQVNDSERVDHRGRGRLADIEDTLKRHPRLTAVAGVLTTVTNRNADRLLETAEYVAQLGIGRWDTTLFQPLGRAAGRSAEFVPETAAVIESYLALFDAVEAGRFKQMSIGPVLRYVRNVLSDERRSMCLCDGCGAGAELVVVNVDGTIQACDSIGDASLNLGKIDSMTVDRALDVPVAQRIRGRCTDVLSPCQTCDWRHFCGGTCLARGGLDTVDHQECEIALAIFPEIFRRLAISNRLRRYVERCA
jgi:uncharacterized protein